MRWIKREKNGRGDKKLWKEIKENIERLTAAMTKQTVLEEERYKK